MDITKFSQQELFDDRVASLADIEICKFALLHDVQEYSGGNVKRRLEVNQGIVAMIDEELSRRATEQAIQRQLETPEDWADEIIKQDIELLENDKPCR